MKNKLKPGKIVKVSGQYKIVGSKIGKAKREVTAVKGKPLPPTPKRGLAYKLTDPTKHKKPRR